MQWVDSTSYSQKEPYGERKPRSWTLKLTRDIRVSVISEHIYYKGQWIVYCPPWFEQKTLDMPSDKFTAEQAQAKAIELVRAEVEKINAALAAA